MNKRVSTVLVVGASLLFLSACSTTMLSPVDRYLDIDTQCRTQAVPLSDAAGGEALPPAGERLTVTDGSGDLSPGYIKAIVDGRATVDLLLDCALAKVETDEARLYRGHVVLSLLATYGAYNYELGAYEERVGDVVTYLVHIRQAELALRGASGVLGGGDDESFVERQKRLERVVYVVGPEESVSA